MNEEKQAEVAKWLIKSQRDLGSAARLLEGETPYRDTAVYHCQQAVEKALKAFLAIHDVELRRTHDLTELLADCTGIDSRFAAREADAQELTPFAVAFRYPGDAMEPGKEEAEGALKLARDMVDFVLKLMPAEVHPTIDKEECRDDQDEGSEV